MPRHFFAKSSNTKFHGHLFSGFRVVYYVCLRMAGLIEILFGSPQDFSLMKCVDKHRTLKVASKERISCLLNRIQDEGVA